MSETLTMDNPIETKKTRTHHAKIVVEYTTGEPYYSIEWFDPAKNEYRLGYSSYYIDNVAGWLAQYFEIVEKPKTNADRIRATDDELATMLHAVKMGYRPWCDYHCKNEGDDGCDNCIKKWLQQPAEGE